MIENLNGIREVVEFKAKTHMRLYENVESEAYPPHCHTPIEFIVPLEKGYRVICSNRTFDLQVGDTLLITPGSLHSMPAAAGRRLIFLVDSSVLHGIMGISATLTSFSPALHVDHHASPKLSRRVQRLLLEMAEEYYADAPLHEAAIYARIIEILVLIHRHHVFPASLPENGGRKAEHIDLLLTICDYINKHYDEDLTLDQIAGLSGFSKYYFSRLFKQYTQMSFYKYLNNKRIENATRLLIDDRLSITDVAFRCGFGSSSAFTRTFKTVHDCTPSEFQTMFINKQDISHYLTPFGGN
ncbi:MAG: AraC family transcriptional regulator [Lachnospiraceae bacterium]|jgi:AraC-like DNA-binding protein|nr:AraC family transcriptional regulator [Lachnospiraceae bacterium]